jgi:hypothetical protein
LRRGNRCARDRRLSELAAASQRLDAWIEQEAFKGWDPFDALNSPLLKRLAFGRRRLGQIWVQALKRAPINLRPWLGAPKTYNPKGMGLFLASYWRQYLLSGDPGQLGRAKFFAGWLKQHANQPAALGGSPLGWGYPFDWPNRGFLAPAGTPTIVNTAFIGLAFMDLVDLDRPTGEHFWGDEPLQVARCACEFILRQLNVIHPAEGELCFSYTPLDARYIHNANLLGAWLLARVAAHTGEADLQTTALAAARYTARRQRADGAWLYGEGARDGWVDNFHTGYVLVALKRLGSLLQTEAFEPAIEQGYYFWKTHFFDLGGAPKYYPDRLYPIDSHCAAQAVLTFLEFADRDPQARQQATRVATWAARQMQAPQGFFYYQRHAWYTNRIPYMRWSQAWMQRAFAELAWNGAL